MLRVHVTGASGCGITTLGQNLGLKLNVPTFDADSYYWETTDPPFRRSVPVSNRQQNLAHDLDRSKNWIVTGSIDTWSAPVESFFTHILFLHAPCDVRLRRLLEREKRHWGARIEPGGDMHSAHLQFIEWAKQYDQGHLPGRSLSRHNTWLSLQTCQVHKLDATKSEIELLNDALRFLFKTKHLA